MPINKNYDVVKIVRCIKALKHSNLQRLEQFNLTAFQNSDKILFPVKIAKVDFR